MKVVEKQIEDIKNDIKSGQDWYAYTKLERMLRDIAERPTWSLIRTLEHRPFMADCIERFEKRIVMASDGLRSNGFDKATIRRIGQRASKSGATVHIWWGRHAPGSKPFDELDARGRKDAKNQLAKLRNFDGGVNDDAKRGRIQHIHEKGFGFIQTKSVNVFVPNAFVEKYQLKSGNEVEFIEEIKPGKKNPSVRKFTKITWCICPISQVRTLPH